MKPDYRSDFANKKTYRDDVLGRRKLGYQLRRLVLLRDPRVIRRKLKRNNLKIIIQRQKHQTFETYGVTLETEVANPNPSPEVNLAEWVEDGTTVASRAKNRVVHQRWQVGLLLHRSVKYSEGNDETGRFETAGRPDVPTEAHAVAFLVLHDVFLVSCHCGFESATRVSRQTRVRIFGKKPFQETIVL